MLFRIEVSRVAQWILVEALAGKVEHNILIVLGPCVNVVRALSWELKLRVNTGGVSRCQMKLKAQEPHWERVGWKGKINSKMANFDAT